MMGGMGGAEGAPMEYRNNTCVAQSTLYSSCTTATDGTGQVLKDNRYFIDNKAYSGDALSPLVSLSFFSVFSFFSIFSVFSLFFLKACWSMLVGGDQIPGFRCGNGNWSAWLETGQDAGSTVSGKVPAIAEMVSWGEALLGF